MISVTHECVSDVLLCTEDKFSVIVQKDEATCAYAIKEELECAELCLGTIQVDMQETDFRGSRFLEYVRQHALHDPDVLKIFESRFTYFIDLNMLFEKAILF